MTEWLTVREAATYLKVSRTTIFAWCASGQLPYYTFATGQRGDRRFKKEDLDTLLEPGRPDGAASVDSADGGG